MPVRESGGARISLVFRGAISSASVRGKPASSGTRTACVQIFYDHTTRAVHVLMGRPKRETLATHEETLNPPATLEEGQSLARVIKATGNNLYNVELPNGKTALVELPARFRSTFWLKRGGCVLVDATTLAARENKIDGEIINIVGDEKVWRKMAYW